MLSDGVLERRAERRPHRSGGKPWTRSVVSSATTAAVVGERVTHLGRDTYRVLRPDGPRARSVVFAPDGARSTGPARPSTGRRFALPRIDAAADAAHAPYSGLHVGRRRTCRATARSSRRATSRTPPTASRLCAECGLVSALVAGGHGTPGRRQRHRGRRQTARAVRPVPPGPPRARRAELLLDAGDGRATRHTWRAAARRLRRRRARRAAARGDSDRRPPLRRRRRHPHEARPRRAQPTPQIAGCSTPTSAAPSPTSRSPPFSWPSCSTA